MEKTKTTSVKASSIRRALTTLKKAGFLNNYKITSTEDGSIVFFGMTVPEDLVQQKKRIRKPKK